MGLRSSCLWSLSFVILPSVMACSSSGGGAPADEDTGILEEDTSVPVDGSRPDSTVGDAGSDSGKDATTTDAPRDGDAAIDTADAVVDTGSPFCKTPGAIESEPCGKCGTHSRLCAGDGGTWLPWGACTGEVGDCTPLEARSTPCGKCGKRAETCSPKCVWEKSTCTDEGLCNPGDVETEYSCPTARQTKTRTCDSTCTWGTLSACAAIKGWDDMAVAPISGRHAHTAVWTGSDMVVWGGQSSLSSYAADGAKYNLATDTWTTLTAAPIVGRYAHVAVAAGTNKMIVWGGYNGSYRNDGAVLDVTTGAGTWTVMSPPPATFYGRYYASAVWTGTEMLVYGGYGTSCSGSYCADAALYDPVANSWRTMPAAPIVGRYQSAMVWNGTKAVVFGGYGSGCSGSYCADGAVLDPSGLGTWSALKATAPLDGRYLLLGVANGTQATFWGGYGTYVSPSYYKNTGASYDDTAGTWKSFTPPIDLVLPNSKRREPVGWWAGGKLYVWGGYDGSTLGTGAIYDPTTDSWTSMPTTNAPTPRYQTTAVWTGAEAIIWGGYSYKADGKVYRP
jgi:N-acetylneuraminic acid mutarotase